MSWVYACPRHCQTKSGIVAPTSNEPPWPSATGQEVQREDAAAGVDTLQAGVGAEVGDLHRVAGAGHDLGEDGFDRRAEDELLPRLEDGRAARLELVKRRAGESAVAPSTAPR